MATPIYEHELMYDLTRLKPGQLVLTEFPELAAQPEFAAHGAGDNDCYLRAAILYVDRGSGLRHIIDVQKRRMEALREAKVPNKTKEEKDRIRAILAFEDVPMADMVMRYLRLVDDLNYALWLQGREMAWLNTKKIGQVIKTAASPLEAKMEPQAEGAHDGDADQSFVNDEAATKQLVFAKPRGRKPQSEDLKEDAELRAYLLKMTLFTKMPAVIDELAALERKLFNGDTDMRKRAVLTAATSPEVSIEDLIDTM